jgi:hypothetical protein
MPWRTAIHLRVGPWPAVNQDGYGNGLTAPNLLAQQTVIRQALERRNAAGRNRLHRAHGTGQRCDPSVMLCA